MCASTLRAGGALLRQRRDFAVCAAAAAGWEAGGCGSLGSGQNPRVWKASSGHPAGAVYARFAGGAFSGFGGCGTWAFRRSTIAVLRRPRLSRVSIQSGEPFCAANRATFQQALQGLHRSIRLREECVSRQLRVRFRESVLAGSAFAALDAPFAKGTSFHADRVLTSDAGHRISPLDRSAEKCHNEFGSGSWRTPRSGLALPTASTGDRAVSCYSVIGGGLPMVGLLSFATALCYSTGPFVFDSVKSFQAVPAQTLGSGSVWFYTGASAEVVGKCRHIGIRYYGRLGRANRYTRPGSTPLRQ